MRRKGVLLQLAMDEKTEELRDIFTSVSDTNTVTEGQEETRGSLTDRGDVTERLADTVSTMREQYEFATDLDDDALSRLVEAFFDGASDADLATTLDVPPETVFRARMDLHLFREDDADAPFEMGELRERLNGAESIEDVAADLGESPATVRRYRRVLDARYEARCANHRFRNEFETVLGEDLTDRLASDVREDGLKEATEGMETDVSL